MAEFEKVEDPQSYLNEVQLSFKYKEPVELRRLALSKKALDQSVYWDVATETCKHLTQEIFDETPGFFETCEEVLQYLIEHGNPKELMIVILEHTDDYKDDLKYLTLSKAVQTVLLRIPKNRHKSLDITLETLVSHVANLELPDEQNLEGEEKKLFEGDPNVARIGEVVRMFLDFLEPFIWEVSLHNPKNTRQSQQSSTRQIREITRYLLKVLEHPLLFVDLSHTDETGCVAKTRCRENAETVVQYLSEIHPDFHKLVVSSVEANEILSLQKSTRAKLRKDKKPEGDGDGEVDLKETMDALDVEEPMSELGLTCFTYLVHGEQLGRDNWPSVFSHGYVLEHTLPSILKLLGKAEGLVIYKGIFLAEAILDKLPKKCLDAELLEKDDVTGFVKALVEIMMKCSIMELRQLAVKLLPYYIKKFTLPGRYKLFESILRTTTHAGLAGYVVQMIKDQLESILKSPEGHREMFLGSSLEKIVTLALELPEGVTSDLLDQSDRIMAGLNLIRFAVLRDPPQNNVTGIWDRIKLIEKKFLDQLKTGLNMSRAHYELELKNVIEKKDKHNDADKFEMMVNIGGLQSPIMSKEQQIEVIRSALITFDMMESVHGRVTEIIASQLKASKDLHATKQNQDNEKTEPGS